MSPKSHMLKAWSQVNRVFLSKGRMGRGGKGAEVIEGALAGTLDPGAFLCFLATVIQAAFLRQCLNLLLPHHRWHKSEWPFLLLVLVFFLHLPYRHVDDRYSLLLLNYLVHFLNHKKLNTDPLHYEIQTSLTDKARKLVCFRIAFLVLPNLQF